MISAMNGSRPYETVSSTTASAPQGQGQSLQLRGRLAEQRHPEQHDEQRCHEVAECGLDDPVVDDGPDVGRPVGGDEQGGDREAHQDGAVAHRCPQRAPAMTDGDDHRHDRGGAGDAPCDQLEWIEVGELLPVDGEEAPQAVGGDRCPDADRSLVVGVAVHGRRPYGDVGHVTHNVRDVGDVRCAYRRSRGPAAGPDRRGATSLDRALGRGRAHGGGDVADAGPAARAGRRRG